MCEWSSCSVPILCVAPIQSVGDWAFHVAQALCIHEPVFELAFDLDEEATFSEEAGLRLGLAQPIEGVGVVRLFHLCETKRSEMILDVTELGDHLHLGVLEDAGSL